MTKSEEEVCRRQIYGQRDGDAEEEKGEKEESQKGQEINESPQETGVGALKGLRCKF